MTGLTNIILPLGVQFAGGVHALAEYSVATIPMAVALAIGRGVSMQTLLLGHSFSEVKRLKLAIASCAFVSAIAVCLLVIAVELSHVYILIAASAPISVLQDLARQRWFGLRRPWRALASDMVWLGGFLIGLADSLAVSTLNVFAVLLSFSLSGALSLIFVAWGLRGQSGLSHECSVSILTLVSEFGGIFGLAQVSQLFAGLYLPLNVIGTSRSAAVALSPLGILISFGQSYRIPRLHIMNSRSSHREAFIQFILSVAGTLLILGSLFVFRSSAQSLGFVLNWAFVLALLTWALGLSLGSAVSILLVYVRQHNRVRAWLPTRLGIAVAEPFFTILLALTIGPPGLSSAAVTKNLLQIVLLSRRGRRTMKENSKRFRRSSVDLKNEGA